jgi:hypothetical protein
MVLKLGGMLKGHRSRRLGSFAQGSHGQGRLAVFRQLRRVQTSTLLDRVELSIVTKLGSHGGDFFFTRVQEFLLFVFLFRQKDRVTILHIHR